MEQIFPENWAVLHLGLIFVITLALMLVVYVLSDSSPPPAGLGLFTVYFMAALLGWLALTLEQGMQIPLAVDLPSVAAILNSYILFLAVGQRAGLQRGRVALGVACLLGCLSVFFLPAASMFLAQSCLATLFFTGAGLISARRSRQRANVGDAIIAMAGLLMLVGNPIALSVLFVAGDELAAHTIGFGVYSCAYVLVALGFLTSVLIEYQQYLSHLATEDPLTRLPNRRGLAEILRVSLAQASRHHLPTAAIAADIDHFNKVNDSFGHETGDSIIRQVAAKLQRLCRASDVIARSGGEEFLIVLPDTDLGAARLLAERLRAAFADEALLVDQQAVPVTLSFGVACATGEILLDELAREAQRAMYLAKRGGRNRVASVDNRPVHLSNTGTGG